MRQVLHQQLKQQFETLQVMKHIQLSHECNSPPSSRSCFALDKIKYHFQLFFRHEIQVQAILYCKFRKWFATGLFTQGPNLLQVT